VCPNTGAFGTRGTRCSVPQDCECGFGAACLWPKGGAGRGFTLVHSTQLDPAQLLLLCFYIGPLYFNRQALNFEFC
jgi:hypothetical protein